MGWVGRALKITLFQPPSWNKGHLSLDLFAHPPIQPDLEDFQEICESLPVFLNKILKEILKF